MCWLIWRFLYLFRRRPKDLDAALVQHARTRNPWRTFRPSVIRNPGGNHWHVYLAAERDYTVPFQLIEVTLHCEEVTGAVVGFTVTDEELARHTGVFQP